MLRQNNFNYRIYYEDTDAGNVVYHANYLKFFERARTDFFRSLNISQSELVKKEGLAFIIRKCEIEYISPAKLDDLLEVSVEVIKISAASIVMSQKARKLNSTLSSLNVEVVCVDAKSFKPKKLPKKIVNALQVHT